MIIEFFKKNEAYKNRIATKFIDLDQNYTEYHEYLSLAVNEKNEKKIEKLKGKMTEELNEIRAVINYYHYLFNFNYLLYSKH